MGLASSILEDILKSLARLRDTRVFLTPSLHHSFTHH